MKVWKLTVKKCICSQTPVRTGILAHCCYSWQLTTICRFAPIGPIGYHLPSRTSLSCLTSCSIYKLPFTIHYCLRTCIIANRIYRWCCCTALPSPYVPLQRQQQKLLPLLLLLPLMPLFPLLLPLPGLLLLLLPLNTYTYTYTWYTYVHVYIYIYREREIDR